MSEDLWIGNERYLVLHSEQLQLLQLLLRLLLLLLRAAAAAARLLLLSPWPFPPASATATTATAALSANLPGMVTRIIDVQLLRQQQFSHRPMTAG